MEDIMARGKNKAKQTKIARELKYISKNLDVLALSQELHSTPSEINLQAIGDYQDNFSNVEINPKLNNSK
jgi:hypothetical protein